jgi:hypothetical protein
MSSVLEHSYFSLVLSDNCMIIDLIPGQLLAVKKCILANKSVAHMCHGHRPGGEVGHSCC